MFIFKKISDLRQYLNNQAATSGFIPTMGALHKGHLSLIEKAKHENKMTVCSIFVNPAQFNDAKDFEQYPITIDSDIDLLDQVGIDLLFLPSVDEMYPNGIKQLKQYDIGYLDTILDGKFRPGHFNGVSNIVSNLLDAVQPSRMYMGEKDFQQCLVVKRLLELKRSSIELITCPTRREGNGLAMSSRNELLSKGAREKASALFYILRSIREEMVKVPFSELQERYLRYLHSNLFEPEYIILAEADTLTPLLDFDQTKKMVVLMAVKIEGVRLIDNLRLN